MNWSKCSVCGKPATQSVNINITCAASMGPSRFEPRCAEHGLNLPNIFGHELCQKKIDQLTDAIKLMIGREENIPFTEVPQKDVDDWVQAAIAMRQFIASKQDTANIR